MAKVAKPAQAVLIVCLFVGTAIASGPVAAASPRWSKSDVTADDLIALARAREYAARAAELDRAGKLVDENSASRNSSDPVAQLRSKIRAAAPQPASQAGADEVLNFVPRAHANRVASQNMIAQPGGVLPEAVEFDTYVNVAHWAEAQEELPTQSAPAQPSEVIADDTAIAADSSPVFLHTDGSPIGSGLWGLGGGCCQAGFFAGVEGTFLAPINEPTQQVILTDLVNNTTTTATADPGFGAGVRTWIGFAKCGWGIRAGYWHFGNDAVQVDPTVPVNKEPTAEGVYHLSANVVDIELIQRFQFCRRQINTSFGARYANLRRNATAIGYGDVGNGVSLLGLAMGANEIEGTGFTASIGSRTPLFCWLGRPCDTCGLGLDSCCCPRGKLFGFCNFRGSILWADSTASVLTDATAITKGIAAAAANSRDAAFATKDHNEDIAIFDIQIGAEYVQPLRCLPASLFVRAAFEYQHWETGNVFAQSNSFAFLQGTPPFGGRVDASANAHDGNLDLIGFTVGGGLTF